MSRRPGWDAIVDQVPAILFIRVLRAVLNRGEVSQVIAGFSDEPLGPALAAIHAQPAHPLVLQEFARKASMSHTVFADRFKEYVGFMAMDYLSRWQVQVARRELLDTGDIVASVRLEQAHGLN